MATVTLLDPQDWQLNEGDTALVTALAGWGHKTTIVSNVCVPLMELGRLPLDTALCRLMIRSDLADWRRLDTGHGYGAMRRAALGAWKLVDVAEEGRHAKGKREAEYDFSLARLALEERPDITRRELVEWLMQHHDGREVLFKHRKPRSTGDPVYKAAYKRIDRRLKRGFELAGEPADFRRLV